MPNPLVAAGYTNSNDHPAHASSLVCRPTPPFALAYREKKHRHLCRCFLHERWKRRARLHRYPASGVNPERPRPSEHGCYAAQLVEEIVAHCGHDYPGRDLIRRAPPFSRPKLKLA